MKQTLFEAEAVLSANTAGMLADIDAAVAAAKAKMQTLQGSWGIGGGGGGGGSGGGGRGGRLAEWYKARNIQIETARAAGDYAKALKLVDQMEKSGLLTRIQALAIEKKRQDIYRQRNTAQLAQDIKNVKADDKLVKTNNNDFYKQEMAAAKAARAIGDYGEALRRLRTIMTSSGMTKDQRNTAYQRSIEVTNQANRASERSSQKGLNDFYKQQMILVDTARVMKDYNAALSRLTALSNNARLSQTQLLAVQKTYQSVLKQSKAEFDKNVRQRDSGDRAAQREVAAGLRAQETAARNAANETRQFTAAQVRAATSAGEFNRAVQIQTDYIGTLTHGTTEYYNAIAKLQHLQNLGSQAGDPLARQRNAMVQNLSFGIQDLAVVLSMGGGLSRGLAAASNNLSFMTSMMGTTAGAAGGLAITLGAIALPAIIKYATGVQDVGIIAEETTKRIKDLNDAVSELGRRFDEYSDARKLSTAGDVSGIKDEVKEIETAIKKQKQLNDEIALQARQARGGAASETTKAWGAFAEALPRHFFGISPEEFQAKIASGEITSGELRAKASEEPGIANIFGEIDAVRALADAIDKINEESKEGAKEFGELQEKLNTLNKAMEEAWKLPAESFKDNIDPFGDTDFQDFAKQQRERATKETQKANKQLGAQESLFERLFPKEAALDNLKREYKSAFGEILSPEQQAAFDFEAARINRTQRANLVGTMGGSEFASQLTNQLLQKDPTTELVKFASQQTGLQEQIRDSIKVNTDKLSELSLSPFQNN